ncbi:MAG: hypothetical protein WCN87_04010 [Chlamydiota bacterium]
MAKPLVSRHKADKLALATFLVGLAILSYTESWWPGLALALGAALFAKRLFEGKYYESLLTLAVFGAVFASVKYNISWIAALFLIAAIVLVFQAFMNTPADEIEEEEELEKELEEDD